LSIDKPTGGSFSKPSLLAVKLPRECWTYYTVEITPVFTVFAHGMAAVSVWRVTEMAKSYVRVWEKYQEQRYRR